MTNAFLSSAIKSLLLVFFLRTLHLTDAADVNTATDGMCRLYDYITGFSLEVNNGLYKLGDAFCQGLPQPHAGQPTQCLSVNRKVNGNSESWNQCPSGFYLQGNQQMEMICCKPSSHPYTWYNCLDVQVKAGSYEVECPAGLIVAKTRDKECDSSVCTSAISCCAIPDEPGPVKNLDDVKARVMDDTQVPLSLLAHFLGFGWCGGCDGRYVGESMEKSGDKWISSTSDSCSDSRETEGLQISYSDFKLIFSEPIAYSEVTHSDLKPALLSSGDIVNNDTSVKTFTVGQEIFRAHTISHTKLTSFTLSENTEFRVSFKSSIFGGLESSTARSFGYETKEEEVKGTETSEGSSISYTSQMTLEPCTALKYKIRLASGKATQYYNATIDVSYSATLQGTLRYREEKDDPYTNFHNEYRGKCAKQLPYTFGSSERSFYDDLDEQSRNDKGPWEWKNMKDRYKTAGTLLDILTDHSRHQFDLEGRFDEIIGNSAYILFQKATPPPGCTVPGRKKRSASNNDFEETLIRYVDLETGSYSDIADADTDEITESDDDSETEKDEEKTLYYLPTGDRNSKFDFSKFFVELEDDNLIQPAGGSGKKCTSSALECHRCLIVVCIVGVVLGKWFYAT